jgi:hypothetical protein
LILLPNRRPVTREVVGRACRSRNEFNDLPFCLCFPRRRGRLNLGLGSEPNGISTCFRAIQRVCYTNNSGAIAEALSSPRYEVFSVKRFAECDKCLKSLTMETVIGPDGSPKRSGSNRLTRVHETHMTALASGVHLGRSL